MGTLEQIAAINADNALTAEDKQSKIAALLAGNDGSKAETPSFPAIGSSFESAYAIMHINSASHFRNIPVKGAMVTLIPKAITGLSEESAKEVKLPLWFLEAWQRHVLSAAKLARQYKESNASTETTPSVSSAAPTATPAVITDTPTATPAVSTETAPAVSTVSNAAPAVNTAPAVIASPPQDNDCFAVTSFDYREDATGVRQYCTYQMSGDKVLISRYKVLPQQRAVANDTNWRMHCTAMTEKLVTPQQAYDGYYIAHQSKFHYTVLKAWQV